MAGYKRERYLEAPVRKAFGWSPYLQEKVTTYSIRSDSKIVSQEAVISGKKFYLFGKAIWDYQIEVVDYREYKKL
jgi:hypothetical protein